MKRWMEIFVYIAFVINLLAIVLNFLVELNLSGLIEVGGLLYFIALCTNISIIFFNFATFNRNDEKGKILKILCYIYLVFLFFGLILFYFKQFIFIAIMDVTSIQYLLANLIQSILYFGILGFGLLLLLFDLKYLQRPKTWKIP
ncbi:MAG: hypothetical protein ACTSRS_03605 [Candidatus Helarchaeota archaeon]